VDGRRAIGGRKKTSVRRVPAYTVSRSGVVCCPTGQSKKTVCQIRTKKIDIITAGAAGGDEMISPDATSGTENPSDNTYMAALLRSTLGTH
jgi:hypothetical protein